jgi:hypothetical protein
MAQVAPAGQQGGADGDRRSTRSMHKRWFHDGRHTVRSSICSGRIRDSR